MYKYQVEAQIQGKTVRLFSFTAKTVKAARKKMHDFGEDFFTMYDDPTGVIFEKRL